MTTATETLKAINSISRTQPAKKVASEQRQLAFSACRFETTGDDGYGPQERYEFADGSALTWDGRGWLAHSHVAV